MTSEKPLLPEANLQPASPLPTALPGTMAPEEAREWLRLSMGLPLLDNKAFCRLFSIDPDTALFYRRSGLIAYIRINRKIYYRLTDVLQLLIKNTYKNDPLFQEKSRPPKPRPQGL